jgi:aldehyde dehydrogenase (NAD+)
VFGHVTPDMTIAREEIFGPVLSVLSYTDDDDAVRIANDTVHGLAAYVQSKDIEHARAIAVRMRRVSLSQLPGLGHQRTVRRLQTIRQRSRIC